MWFRVREMMARKTIGARLPDPAVTMLVRPQTARLVEPVPVRRLVAA